MVVVGMRSNDTLEEAVMPQIFFCRLPPAAAADVWMADGDVLPLLKRHPEHKRVSLFYDSSGFGIFPHLNLLPQSRCTVKVYDTTLIYIFIQHIVFYNAQSVLDVPDG